MKDLFEHYNKLPEHIQDILSIYDDEAAENPYQQCQKLEKALKPHGYTFDWGLDGVPFNLRKINNKATKTFKLKPEEEIVKIDVAFRKIEGETIALFPKEPADHHGNILSYMHIGQHGAAAADLIDELEPASYEEYKYLLSELKRIGYAPVVLSGSYTQDHFTVAEQSASHG